MFLYFYFKKGFRRKRECRSRLQQKTVKGVMQLAFKVTLGFRVSLVITLENLKITGLVS